MPGTIRLHNSTGGNITLTATGSPNGGHSSGKASAGHDITLDLSKAGWVKGNTISLSVHADGGVTRHNKTGIFDPLKDYRYKAQGTIDAFSVTGPE